MFVSGAVVGLVAAPSARAQSSQLDPQLFSPTPGLGSTFTIDRPEVPRHKTFSVGLGASFATGLLVRADDGRAIVPWRGQAELLGALGLFEWLELGAAVPVTLASVADDPFAAEPRTRTVVGAGDVRLAAKVPILRGDFRLAGRAVVSLPSGDGDELLGSGYWTLTPGMVASYRRSIVNLAAELGYRLRRRATLGDLEYDDELHVAAGATVDLVDSLALVAEATLRIGVGGRSLNANEVPMELGGGLRWAAGKGWTVDVGVGTGLLAGYGAPTVRAFTIVRYASEREPCEAGPEDFDGFEDDDFCADPDNDGDGIPDVEDECPNDPEDLDGFLDDDGCPDPDNDADGVLDEDDECPLRSEDRDGWQDLDGCPDEDNDDDGIPDGLDECPMEPEDLDGYEDDDGCPEPGPDHATVTVTDTRILISERIYFDFDRDTIRPVSRPLLDQVAEVVRDLPPSRRVRVEGYTDSAGREQYNVDLSYRRARSVVQYLVSQGVPRKRLDYVGYGSKNPVAPNDAAEGRALNRRVEFTILEPGDRSVTGRRR
ncbi:MAG: OmpA family protein [Myxococcota bacterium]